MDDVAVSQRTFKYPITTGDQQVCMCSMPCMAPIGRREVMMHKHAKLMRTCASPSASDADHLLAPHYSVYI